MELNKIYHFDFLDNDLEESSVDLIIADPPYYKIKGEFDFKWATLEDYLEDVKKWALECRRILKPNGTLFWYGDEKNIAYSQIILDEFLTLTNNLVWYKYNLRGGMFGSTGSDSINSFPICTERILMYSKDDEYNLTDCVHSIRDYIRAEITKAKGKVVLKDVNRALGTATSGGGVASSCLGLKKEKPSMITKEMYQLLQNWCNPFLSKSYELLREEYEALKEEYNKTRRVFNNQFRLNEVLQFNTDTSNKYNHDTVKPEALSRALIMTCTNVGGLVFVPFAGSGTECAMSVKEGRRFIGFEIDKEHIKEARKRVETITEKVNENPTLF